MNTVSHESLWLAGLLLLAVVVGMLLVVLFELRRSIRALVPTVGRVAEQARRTLSEVELAAQRFNRVGGALENEADLHGLFETLRDTSSNLRRVNRMLQVTSAAGTAIGPALAAFLAVLADRSQSAAQAPPQAPADGARRNGTAVSAA